MQNNTKPTDASATMSAGSKHGATMPANGAAGASGTMDSNKKSDMTITIDGMSGDACVQKVKASLNGIDGVTTQSVRMGEAKISATEAGCDSACDAISGAGFKPSCSMAKKGHAGHAAGAANGSTNNSTNSAMNGASGSASASSVKPAADVPGKPGTPGTDAQRSQPSGQNSGQGSGGQQRSTNGTPDVGVKPTPAVASAKH
jgi:copper chaperone CopZ